MIIYRIPESNLWHEAVKVLSSIEVAYQSDEAKSRREKVAIRHGLVLVEFLLSLSDTGLPSTMAAYL